MEFLLTKRHDIVTLSMASNIPRQYGYDPYSGGGAGGGSSTSSSSSSLSTSSSSSNDDTSSSSDSSSSSASSDDGGLPPISLAEFQFILKLSPVHGSLGCLAFGFVFPIGGIIIRTLRGRYVVYIHAAWQILGWAMAVVTMGTGIWMAREVEYLDEYHVAIGLTAVCGVTVQQFTGWIHHRLYKKKGRRTLWSYVHVFWGIAVVTLGAINPPFGMQLAFAEIPKYYIVYGVPAAIVWLTWMIVSIVSQVKRARSGADKIVEGDDAARQSRKERRLQEKAARSDSQ